MPVGRASTAVGPLAFGFLVSFAFVWPFALGPALAALRPALVYVQIKGPNADVETPAAMPQD